MKRSESVLLAAVLIGGLGLALTLALLLNGGEGEPSPVQAGGEGSQTGPGGHGTFREGGIEESPTGTAEKEVLEPGLLDLAIILVIWSVAIYSRATVGWNRWLFILLGVAVGFVAGYLSFWSRALKESSPSLKDKEKTRLWPMWKAFSKRMGGFQSRVFLSFMYFIFVFPFALAVKLFSDPLAIKKAVRASFWVEKKETSEQLDDYRRQF